MDRYLLSLYFLLHEVSEVAVFFFYNVQAALTQKAIKSDNESNFTVSKFL